MKCKHCGKREVHPGSVTCGNSFCQEANYYRNLAQNTKSEKKKSALYKRMRWCEELASK
jgi:hypothetical protein